MIYIKNDIQNRKIRGIFIETLKDLLKSYQSKTINNLYKDKIFNPEGIDYKNYIGLRYETVNKYEIRDKFLAEGWYLLWWLMANAHQAQYIKTTIDFISTETNLSTKHVKELLIKLHNNECIYVATYTSSGKEKALKNITFTDVLEIAIGYSNKEIYKYSSQGYAAIPVDYAKTILPSLEPISWAIYCILAVRFSWFSTSEERVDKDTGEIIYPYSVNHYSFPTQVQIGEYIGVSDTTVKKYVQKLLESKYKPIYVAKDASGYSKNSKGNIRKDNYRYGISLLERFEYQYHNTISVEDKREEKIKQLIERKGFSNLIGTEKQNILRPVDYLLSINNYKQLTDKYTQAIRDKDINWYDSIKNQMTIQVS